MNDNAAPLVSVVIPSYNHAHFLGRALQSVLDQTYTNWEAIVIDNHSQDNTDEVVRSFENSQIALLKIRNNGVIAASRNMGIRAAKGEWIAFLDSDDWWARDKLQKCFEKFSNKVDIIYHDLDIRRETPLYFMKKKIKSRQLKSPVLNDLLINGNVIPNSSVLVRKNILEQIGGLNEDNKMIGVEDYNAWLRIAQLKAGFLYIHQSLGFYQVHSQSVSSNHGSVQTRPAVEEFLTRLNYDQKIIMESRLYFIEGRSLFLKNDYGKAKGYLIESIHHGGGMVKVKSCVMLLIIYINGLAHGLRARI
jgi:glycosyltransferase involved in cell wall biosynthesis